MTKSNGVYLKIKMQLLWLGLYHIMGPCSHNFCSCNKGGHSVKLPRFYFNRIYDFDGVSVSNKLSPPCSFSTDWHYSYSFIFIHKSLVESMTEWKEKRTPVAKISNRLLYDTYHVSSTNIFVDTHVLAKKNDGFIAAFATNRLSVTWWLWCSTCLWLCSLSCSVWPGAWPFLKF